jgi:hypothetical protein
MRWVHIHGNSGDGNSQKCGLFQVIQLIDNLIRCATFVNSRYVTDIADRDWRLMDWHSYHVDRQMAVYKKQMPDVGSYYDMIPQDPKLEPGEKVQN